MKNSSLIASALTVGLVSAWSTAQADQFSVQVSLNPGITLVHSYFAYNSNASGNAFIQVANLGTVTNGEVLTGTAQDPFQASDAYTLLGDFLDANGGEHVAIVLNSFAAGLVTGQSFDSTIGAATGVNEVTVLSYLDNSSSSLIDSYIQTGFPTAKPYLPTIGSSGVIMGFSNGAPIGATNPVPEPASVAALGLGAVALIRRRRRS